MSATDGAVWTVQELSAEGPGFTWPHGTRALIAERKRVQEMQVLQRQIAQGAFYNRTDPGIFKCPLSYEEAFVGSDMARIGLMDRLRMHYNSDWKCDAKDVQREFFFRKREADKLFEKRIEDLMLLQALTGELMPETLELVGRCTDFAQVMRCMLDAKGAW